MKSKRTRKPEPPKTRISLDSKEIVELVEIIKSMHVAKLSTTAVIYAALQRWITDIDADNRQTVAQREQAK